MKKKFPGILRINSAEIRSSAFRTDRKDTYFEKKTIEKQFTKKKKKKIKGSSFTSKFFLIFSF